MSRRECGLCGAAALQRANFKIDASRRRVYGARCAVCSNMTCYPCFWKLQQRSCPFCRTVFPVRFPKEIRKFIDGYRRTNEALEQEIDILKSNVSRLEHEYKRLTDAILFTQTTTPYPVILSVFEFMQNPDSPQIFAQFDNPASVSEEELMAALSGLEQNLEALIASSTESSSQDSEQED